MGHTNPKRAMPIRLNGASKKRYVFAVGLILAIAAIALWQWKYEQSQTSLRPMALVICGDDRFQENRVYRVDLLAGNLEAVSAPIDWLGNPAHIAYDPVHSLIYIASMRGSASDYWPVTAVQMGVDKFEVAKRFSTNSGGDSPSKRNEHPPNKVYEAYRVIVSPDGNELYVAHGGLATSSFLISVWDGETGEVLRHLSTPIESDYLWSADGYLVAEIWPSGKREISANENGVTKEWKGGTSVRSTQTGKQITIKHLKDNQGMHPPWGRINEPFIYFPSRELGVVRVYDRDTGEIISEFDIQELTGLQLQSSPMGDRSAVLKGGRLLAVAMRTDQSQRLWDGNEAGSDYPSYIVLIDMLEQREITRTQVGLRCSNAVVAYE